MRGAILVGLGGMAGCLARYWIGGWVQQLSDADFPFGTMTVNLAGCFVIGFVLALSLDRGVLGPNTRLLLTTGFCGGFTTMSTFSYETVALLADGQNGMALWYVGGTIAGSLIAVLLGQLAGRLL